jgi:hypothetical protein
MADCQTSAHFRCRTKLYSKSSSSDRSNLSSLRLHMNASSPRIQRLSHRLMAYRNNDRDETHDWVSIRRVENLFYDLLKQKVRHEKSPDSKSPTHRFRSFFRLCHVRFHDENHDVLRQILTSNFQLKVFPFFVCTNHCDSHMRVKYDCYEY